ncbi:unnamed protein product [Bursaphelenchus okinawaensis]|uniref:Uncharacterized protein n=1 Tax=Bursaphelenchus okinawaensis TaxID=465554 RepID=A0A811KUG0_9BILA|nr:unnamed protein product [Bursaphelenchus okinawaensis]CAG9111201.1 unnamed protein product [Bursaphelenchus okinawaensis]
MKSTVVVLLVVGFVAIEACSPSSSTTTSTTTTTTPAPGRKRRSVEPVEVVLHSNVPVAQSQQLIQKLKNTAASLNLDAQKFGNVAQEVGTDNNGNVELYHTLDGDVDCAEVRQVTKRIIKNVTEVNKATIDCQGEKFRV